VLHEYGTELFILPFLFDFIQYHKRLVTLRYRELSLIKSIKKRMGVDTYRLPENEYLVNIFNIIYFHLLFLKQYHNVIIDFASILTFILLSITR